MKRCSWLPNHYAAHIGMASRVFHCSFPPAPTTKSHSPKNQILKSALHHHVHILSKLLDTIQQSPAKHHTCDLSLTTHAVATASYIFLFVKQNSIELHGWEHVQHLITIPGLDRSKMLQYNKIGTHL